MGWNDFEAIAAYLRSLAAGRGMPSQKELDCLKRVKMWEKTMAFVEEMENSGGGGLTPSPGAAVDCLGYGRDLTPWQCLENQLSLYCLKGWPCETCEEAVGIVVKGKSFHCVHLGVEVSQGLCAAARVEAQRRQTVWPEGMGWLEVCFGCDIYAKVGRPGRDPALQEASTDPQSGAPALKKPKPQPKRRPAWWKNASKAVQRDWLREREGRS